MALAAGAFWYTRPIMLEDLYPELELFHNGTTWRCTTAGMDRWQSGVMELIMAHQS